MTEGYLYLKNNLEGMNNDELILFIYQEMLKILNQIHIHFENRDIESRVNSINKAIEVVNTLMSILNYEAGEISFRLRSLYVYSINRLTAANFNKDPEPVKEVSKLFKVLYEAWGEKIKKDKQNAAEGIIPQNENVKTKRLEVYG